MITARIEIAKDGAGEKNHPCARQYASLQYSLSSKIKKLWWKESGREFAAFGESAECFCFDANQHGAIKIAKSAFRNNWHSDQPDEKLIKGAAMGAGEVETQEWVGGGSHSNPQAPRSFSTKP
jgi:hypothetical protein